MLIVIVLIIEWRPAQLFFPPKHHWLYLYSLIDCCGKKLQMQMGKALGMWIHQLFDSMEQRFVWFPFPICAMFLVEKTGRLSRLRN